MTTHALGQKQFVSHTNKKKLVCSGSNGALQLTHIKENRVRLIMNISDILVGNSKAIMLFDPSTLENFG